MTLDWPNCKNTKTARILEVQVDSLKFKDTAQIKKFMDTTLLLTQGAPTALTDKSKEMEKEHAFSFSDRLQQARAAKKEFLAEHEPILDDSCVNEARPKQNSQTEPVKIKSVAYPVDGTFEDRLNQARASKKEFLQQYTPIEDDFLYDPMTQTDGIVN